MESHPTTARTRTEAQLNPDGSVRCHCHKKLAQVQTDGTLLLYCRNCRCDVSLDLKQQKVAALMSIAERIDTLAPRSPEESIQSLTQIASLIAAL